MAYGVYQELVFNLLHMAIVEDDDFTSADALEALEILREQTLEICELCQIEDRGINISASFPPGYLSKEFGQWRIAIPWPLVDGFPEDECLEEFCKFALSARVGKESSVCISGTSARAGAVPEIGDIDFSEYVFDDKAELPALFLTTLRADNDKCFSVEAKVFCGNHNEAINFSEYGQNRFDELLAKYPDFFENLPTCQSKIDFIGKSNGYGYIPVSNMIFPSEYLGQKVGISMRSFSFQEAVVFFSDTSKSKVWPLLNIDEMIRYIEFLVKDAKKYIKLRPVKAAKRAGALARFLYLHDHDLVFAKLLKSRFVREDAVLCRHEEVERMLDFLPATNDRAAQVRVALQDFKGNDTSLCDTIDDDGVDAESCVALVESLIGDIISRLNRLDPRLGDHFSDGVSG